MKKRRHSRKYKAKKHIHRNRKPNKAKKVQKKAEKLKVENIAFEIEKTSEPEEIKAEENVAPEIMDEAACIIEDFSAEAEEISPEKLNTLSGKFRFLKKISIKRIIIFACVLMAALVVIAVVLFAHSIKKEKMSVGSNICTVYNDYIIYKYYPDVIGGLSEAKGRFVPEESSIYSFYALGNITVFDEEGNPHKGNYLPDGTAYLELECRAGKKYRVSSKTEAKWKYIVISENSSIDVGENKADNPFFRPLGRDGKFRDNNICYLSFTPEKDGYYTFSTGDPNVFVSLVSETAEYKFGIGYDIEAKESDSIYFDSNGDERIRSNVIHSSCFAGQPLIICAYNSADHYVADFVINVEDKDALSLGNNVLYAGEYSFSPKESGYYRIRSISELDYDISIDGYDNKTIQDFWLYQSGDKFSDMDDNDFCTCVRAGSGESINFAFSECGTSGSSCTVEICRISEEYYNAFAKFIELSEKGVYISDKETICRDTPGNRSKMFSFTESSTQYPRSLFMLKHHLWLCFECYYVEDGADDFAWYRYS